MIAVIKTALRIKLGNDSNNNVYLDAECCYKMKPWKKIKTIRMIMIIVVLKS